MELVKSWISPAQASQVVEPGVSELTQENWNNSLLLGLPRDVRLLLWAALDQPTLLALRRSCSALAAGELHVQSAFWMKWSSARIAAGLWTSWSVNYDPAAAALANTASAVVRRFLQRALDVEEELEDSPDAFRLAMSNARENQRRLKYATSAAVSAADAGSSWFSLQTRQTFFVPIFGEALETTARRLVYRLMGTDDQDPMFKSLGPFPGSGGMGGGMNFQVGKSELKLAPFYSWTQKKLVVSGHMQLVLETCNGLLFVVDDGAFRDATHQLTVCEQLKVLLAVARPKCVILVLNFCMQHDKHVHSPREMLDLMALGNGQRTVSVRNVPEFSDVGVAEGIEWLIEVMAATR